MGALSWWKIRGATVAGLGALVAGVAGYAVPAGAASAAPVQQPPGAVNWAIGSQGERKQRARPFAKEPFLPEGTFDAHGTPVAPASLYLAQLRERLGAGALTNIGY